MESAEKNVLFKSVHHKLQLILSHFYHILFMDSVPHFFTPEPRPLPTFMTFSGHFQRRRQVPYLYGTVGVSGEQELPGSSTDPVGCFTFVHAER